MRICLTCSMAMPLIRGVSFSSHAWGAYPPCDTAHTSVASSNRTCHSCQHGTVFAARSARIPGTLMASQLPLWNSARSFADIQMVVLWDISESILCISSLCYVPCDDATARASRKPAQALCRKARTFRVLVWRQSCASQRRRC